MDICTLVRLHTRNKIDTGKRKSYVSITNNPCEERTKTMGLVQIVLEIRGERGRNGSWIFRILSFRWLIPDNRIRPMISDKLRKSESCSGNLLSFSDNTIGEELS